MTLATSKNLTLVGIFTILGALATAAVAILDGNPDTNPNWEVTFVALSAGLGMILGKGAASTGGTVAETPEAKERVGGFASIRLLLALMAALAIVTALAPRLARADDVPALGVCFDKGNQICLRPIVGFSGAAYDFSQHQVVRSFEVSGLYELTIVPGKLGVAGGAAFQSGTVQGVAISALVTLPYSLALGVSELIVGGEASTRITAGTVLRF
jgi:hypothetical protein